MISQPHRSHGHGPLSRQRHVLSDGHRATRLINPAIHTAKPADKKRAVLSLQGRRSQHSRLCAITVTLLVHRRVAASPRTRPVCYLIRFLNPPAGEENDILGNMHIGMKQLLAVVLRLIFPAEKVVGPAVRIRLDEFAHIGQRQSLIADGPSAGYAPVHSGIGSGSFPVQVNSHLIA